MGIFSFAGVGKYYQAEGALQQFPEIARGFGSICFVLIDAFFFETYAAKLQCALYDAGVTAVCERFGGENSSREITRCVAIARSAGAEVIAAVGGGKALDCGKSIAHTMKRAYICIPTTAATDAPCSSLSIVYDDAANTREVRRCDRNPDVVLVDSRIIANAPIRFLVAGMGDALATYFEACANEASGGDTFNGEGHLRTVLAMAAARACHDTILRFGREAKRDAEKNDVTFALEKVIEANILLSGLGFENTGCAGAHSVSAGIGAVAECGGTLHGERVAFGTLCQVLMEGRQLPNELMGFYMDVGLPITLQDLHIISGQKKKARSIAKASMNKFWDAEPFDVTEEMVYEAIMEVDRIGNVYKRM